MKKIFLLGDSIRIGYCQYVRESMATLAEVFFPEVNCGCAESILRDMHNWKEDIGLDTADAVHFNAGLWDTIRIYGDDPITRPEAYRDYLGRIVKRIRFLFPEAKIIFATTTPVIESGFIQEFETRFNKDIEAYNNIAQEVMSEHDVQINDLYTLLRNVPACYHSDQTHFYTADATELIGGQVTRVLCRALGLNEQALITPDKQKYHIADAKNDTELYWKKGRFYTKTQP